MRNRFFYLVGLSLILWSAAACSPQSSVLPSTATPIRETQPVSPTATEASIQPVLPTAPDEEIGQAVPGCEDYFQFCVTSTTQGTVTTTATGGMNSSSNKNCTTWAEGGAARILELPLMFAAGQDKITVALARIGQYTGPGQYELTAVSTNGLPDVFPTIEAAGQTYSNGQGSTAMVTIAADGSGSIQASKLVQQASIQVSNPDPSAQIDFSMQWTCRDIQ